MKLESPTKIEFKRKKLSKRKLLELYRGILYPRMIEERMLTLLRQGKIGKWFSGIGQEAISVGATMALQSDEFIFPLHRNLGAFTSRDVPLDRMMAQWQGKPYGYTKGRDRSFHFGSMEHHIVGMISHLGPQLSLAAGAAMAAKLNGERKVSLAFTGEAATSEGEFHEALNVAAVWDLPVIFIIENNGYGLSTPVAKQYRCKALADRGVGYGIESVSIDGNNVLEVYRTVDRLATKLREKPRPVLIECMTFRMRGHEEASGTKYVPQELFERWAAKDPIENYQQFLLDQSLLTKSEIKSIRDSCAEQIAEAEQIAFGQDRVVADAKLEVTDVLLPQAKDQIQAAPPAGDRAVRFIDAISEGLSQGMETHSELILMGQDIAVYGGAFKVTAGLLDKYGADRVRDTPLCESAIIGIGIGLSLRGYRAMIEMQFADFVSCGFNQIVNNLAKLNYRWGHSPNVVIRMPTGGGVAAGPFHSQSTEAWFAHTPGLRVVYPSDSYDAKGLLLASLAYPGPVLFFEHKYLYRSHQSPVPEEPYQLDLGKGKIVQEGSRASIITYGLGVHWAREISEDQDIEIVDLTSLQPLDFNLIATSVRKTNRALVLHEDTLTGGLGGEVSAWIGEHLFEELDAPVMRVGSLDTPIPHATELEQEFLAQRRLQEKLQHLLDY